MPMLIILHFSTKIPFFPAGEMFVTYGCIKLQPVIPNKIATAKIRFICLPPNDIIN